jgi:hypothetical protein
LDSFGNLAISGVRPLEGRHVRPMALRPHVTVGLLLSGTSDVPILPET